MRYQLHTEPLPTCSILLGTHAFQSSRISFFSSLSSSPVSISLSELGGYSLPYSTGYTQKGLGSGGLQTWEQVLGCLVLVPPSSRMDPPQAKAGDAPVKTCLRKGRKCQMEGGGGNEVRYKRRTARSEEEMLHDGADIPCSPWGTHTRADIPCNLCKGPRWHRCSHSDPWGNHSRADGCSCRKRSSRRTQTGGDFPK